MCLARKEQGQLLSAGKKILPSRREGRGRKRCTDRRVGYITERKFLSYKNREKEGRGGKRKSAVSGVHCQDLEREEKGAVSAQRGEEAFRSSKSGDRLPLMLVFKG